MPIHVLSFLEIGPVGNFNIENKLRFFLGFFFLATCLTFSLLKWTPCHLFIRYLSLPLFQLFSGRRKRYTSSKANGWCHIISCYKISALIFGSSQTTSDTKSRILTLDTISVFSFSRMMINCKLGTNETLYSSISRWWDLKFQQEVGFYGV